MNVLVIGAHPDDIEPQMGGTIAKLVNKGHNILILQVVDTGNETKAVRMEEAKSASAILGANIKHLNYKQNHFSFNRKLVQDLDQVIEEFNPDEIYTCWEYDSHQDHQIVSKAVLAASRKNNLNLYFFEPIIPGGIMPYGFEVNYFIDISDTMEIKVKSVLAHQSQVEKFGLGWIDAIYGRALFRGFQINVKYAEAFKIVKMIN